MGERRIRATLDIGWRVYPFNTGQLHLSKTKNGFVEYIERTKREQKIATFHERKCSVRFRNQTPRDLCAVELMMKEVVPDKGPDKARLKRVQTVD